MVVKTTCRAVSLLIVLAVTSLTPNAITNAVSDDFEYVDSPANHGWAIEGEHDVSTVYTTTDAQFSGSRSVYIGQGMHITKDLTAVAISQVQSISVMFHDSLFAGGNWDSGAGVHFLGTGCLDARLGYYNSPNYWVFACGSEFASSVPRTAGWHRFEWQFSPGLMVASIDGTNVLSVPLSGQALRFVQLWVGSEPQYGYFDQFNVESTGPVSVGIDIKPGSFPNSINLSAAGVVPVAILSSPTFDAADVDPASITLAGARVKLIGKADKYASSLEDVNNDGLLDRVCHVVTAQFLLEDGDSVAVLEGETFSGQAIQGQDSIRIVPD